MIDMHTGIQWTSLSRSFIELNQSKRWGKREMPMGNTPDYQQAQQSTHHKALCQGISLQTKDPNKLEKSTWCAKLINLYLDQFGNWVPLTYHK